MNSVSPDGVLEGAEIKDRDYHPFLMLVQWHPERMAEQGSVFSKNIREAFLDAVAKNLQERGFDVDTDGDAGWRSRDPWGTTVRIGNDEQIRLS